MLTDPFAVIVVLAGVVWAALYLEERLSFGRSLGAALIGILLGMALSNAGLIPGESEAYRLLSSFGVQLGLVLILLGVDLGSVVRAGPRMLLAFGLGALGSAAGAMVAGLVLSSSIGPETWKLSGQFTGTYTGGGVNFAALGREFETSPNLFSAAVAADVILTAIWMAICLVVPVLLGKTEAPREEIPAEAAPEDAPLPLERSLYETGRSVKLREVAILLTVALGAVWLAERLGVWVPVLPEVFWLTTLALVGGQIRAVRSIPGSALWGNYLVLMFLAGNGAQSVVAFIVRVGPSVFYFALITVAVHGLVIFGLGWLVRLDFGTLAIASQAGVGGAASAMAMASARGYVDRLLPGVAVGLLGYAVGNYLGLVVAGVMRSWLG